MVRCALLALSVACGALSLSQAAAADDDNFSTDANIITALDVSSSIDAQETMLQVDGMAQAIRAPEIVAAIQNGRHGRIGFAVFIWADGDFPELVSWRVIGSPQDAEEASGEISSRVRSIIDAPTRSVGSLTNTSAALEHAAQLLQSSPYASKRAIINIVGDGEDNVGEDPRRIRDELVARGVTINGVVVGGDKNVLEYYRHAVAGGPRGFVLSADKPETLVQVFAFKFMSEIALNIRHQELPDRM
ncbi:DUF1194 domain-containing protein [Dongia deserti]|uniref:DUF1194 domain-containing protein n=1 Tax=Dongia deserti TaxID=2268030 RepID=UPI000E64BAC6|nr:DUF1194 domain-containing protein [Dongia deserti]